MSHQSSHAAMTHDPIERGLVKLFELCRRRLRRHKIHSVLGEIERDFLRLVAIEVTFWTRKDRDVKLFTHDVRR